MNCYPRGGFPEHDQRITYYHKGRSTQNFGDYLPELIAQELMMHPRIQADLYLLTGSLIHPDFIRDLLESAGVAPSGKVAFWGCGMRDSSPIPAIRRTQSVFAGVRGPLTRDALGLPKNTTLGDPGLIAPLLHTPKAHPETSGRVICIPHMFENRSDELLLSSCHADVVVRPVVTSSESAVREILDKIASASFVLSGSLHGAIIACAYNRPFAFWDSGLVDIPFKWADFSASVGIPSIFVKTVEEAVEVYEKQLKPQINKPPLTPILDVCPFAIKPSKLLMAMAADGLVDSATAAIIANKMSELQAEDTKIIHAIQDSAAEMRNPRASLSSLLRFQLATLVIRVKGKIERISKMLRK